MKAGSGVDGRRVLPALLVVAALACAGAGQTQDARTRGASRDEAAVRAADRAWAEAIARGDVRALGELFADEFIIVSQNGDLKNKQQEINNLAPAPDVVTYYFRTEDVEARVYDDAAVVRGRAVWRVKWQGRDIDNNRRYTSTYVKRRGRWLLVAQQISGNISAAVK
ncbi:MAG: nuclear transport factor 2 family protein [Pyrinomonadaceae bacterium]